MLEIEKNYISYKEREGRLQEEYNKRPRFKFIDDDLNIGELELVTYTELCGAFIYAAIYNRVDFNTEIEYDRAYQIAKQYDELEKKRIEEAEKLKLAREQWKEKYK